MNDSGPENETSFNDWEKGRVTQLLSYMTDCQQGIRDVNGQILSVIAATGTMLTLFFGVSIFGNKINETVGRNNGQLVFFANHSNNMIGRLCTIIEELITVRRIAFWFTSIIFLTAVLYIMTLGISNILRYHYCLHLSDRLHSLIQGAKDDIDRNALVSYEQFSSPVTTYNIAHVSNSHNMVNFSAQYVACGLAATFCIGAIITQYILLEVHRWYDKFVLTLVGMTLFVAFTLFVRFNWHSEEVADMAFGIANENLEVRKGIAGEGVKLYRKSRSFQRALLYIALPRRHVLEKDTLIVGGFAAVSLMIGDCHPMHLAFVLIVYSFLLCQARYQINDLRGLEEDEKVGRTDRLNAASTVNKAYLINVSIITCLMRIILAIMLTLFQGRVLKLDIFICGALLFLFTFLYELFRTKKWVWLTFFMVGAGYPIRVYVGAIAQNVEIVRKIPAFDFIMLVVLFWIWGILGSLMSWSREIENLIKLGKMKNGKHPKQHYEILYPLVKAKVDKERQLEQSGYSVKCTFLLRQYKMKDPWNICFWIMLLIIELEAFVHLQSLEYFIIETIVIVLSALTAFRTSEQSSIVLYAIVFLMSAVDVIVHFFRHGNLIPDVYWLFLSLSLTASVLYLRMVPEITFRKVLRKSIYNIKKCLFGKYIADESSKKVDEKNR